jgi:hypothetical protein
MAFRKSDRNSLKEKAIEAIRGCWVIGPIFKILEAIYAFGGWKGLILLGIGFFFALGLFYFGIFPAIFLSSTYKTHLVEVSHPPQVRTKPSHVDIHLVKIRPDFLSPYFFSLEKEADHQKDEKSIKEYMPSGRTSLTLL